MTARELGRALAFLLLLSLLLVAPALMLTALDRANSPWWWDAWQLAGLGAVVAVAAPTVVTGRHPVTGHRLVWAVAFAASVAEWFAVMSGRLSDLGRNEAVDAASPDPVNLVAQVVPIAAAACAAGWRGWIALVPASFLAAAHVLAQASVSGPVGSGDGAQKWSALAEETAFTLGVTMVSIIAIGAVRTSTDRLETTRAGARRRVADAEGAESRRLARILWAAALHDDVLAVLGSVQAGQRPTPEDREAAARALRTSSAQKGPQTWTTAELAEHLEHVVARVSAGALTTSRRSPGPVPPTVSEAVLAATVEAVRNVVRHARTDGRCHVSVTATPGHVEVVVTDDGVGFAATHVPLGRLGLRVAVRDRMQAVGGSGEWLSAPEAGTTVTLRWAAPRSAPGTAETSERPRTAGGPSWSQPAQ